MTLSWPGRVGSFAKAVPVTVVILPDGEPWFWELRTCQTVVGGPGGVINRVSVRHQGAETRVCPRAECAELVQEESMTSVGIGEKCHWTKAVI